MNGLVRVLDGYKTVTAVNRTIIAGFERNHSGYAASRTNSFVHFALCSLSLAAFTAASLCISAVTAACRFILKALARIELLFTGGKNKVFAAVLALKSFVLERH